MLAREPTSFWRENLVAVVTLLRDLADCQSGENKLSNVKSFIILRSEEGVTSFTKGNRANFSGEKWYNEAFRGAYSLRRREKNFKSNLVLVVVLVLESKGLYFSNSDNYFS